MKFNIRKEITINKEKMVIRQTGGRIQRAIPNSQRVATLNLKKQAKQEAKNLVRQSPQFIKKSFGKVTRPTNNTNKQFRKILKKTFKGKGYSTTLSKNLVQQFGGAFGGQRVNVQKGKTGPGRPRGEFKHRSPFNGQPLPATEYYKQVREFRRVQQQTANQIDSQQIQNLARRGIPPQQAQQIINNQQLRSVGINPQPQPPQLTPEQIQFLKRSQPPQFQRPRFVPQPNIQRQPVPLQRLPNGTVVPQGNPIWRWRRGTVDTEVDLMGNRRQVLRGSPQSFFN